MADPHNQTPNDGDGTQGSSPQAGPPPEARQAAAAMSSDPSSVTGPAELREGRRPESPDPGNAPGSALAGRRSSKPLSLQLRRAHGNVAPWVLAPLLLTVSTGVGYRLLRDWGGLGRDQAHGLMVLHEGEWLRQWLGPTGETLYVLGNGLGLLWMLVSGAAMLWERWQRPKGSGGR